VGEHSRNLGFLSLIIFFGEQRRKSQFFAFGVLDPNIIFEWKRTPNKKKMNYIILGTRQQTTAKLSYTALQQTGLPRPWFVICGSQNREKEWVSKQCLIVKRHEVQENVKVLILDNTSPDEFPSSAQLANLTCLIVATALPSKLERDLLDKFENVWVSHTHGAKKRLDYFHLFLNSTQKGLGEFNRIFDSLSGDSDYFVCRPPSLMQLVVEEVPKKESISRETVGNEKEQHAPATIDTRNKQVEEDHKELPVVTPNKRDEPMDSVQPKLNDVGKESEFQLPCLDASRNAESKSILDVEIMHKAAMETWATFRVAEKLSLEGVLVRIQEFLAQDLIRSMFLYASYDRDDKTQDLHFYFQVKRVHELLFSGLLMQMMRALKAENVLERVALIL
jgi:hypothetical protein